MKRLLIPLIAIVASAINIMAQETPAKDILILKNNIKIDCLVQEVSNSQIKYYKLDLPNGPVFIEETSNIDSIMYRDGSVQMYEQSAISETPQNDSSMAQQQNDSLPRNAFQCNLELGGQFTFNNIDLGGESYRYTSGGVDFDLSFGARITKLAFVGAGVGIHSEFASPTFSINKTDYTFGITFVTMPIYVDSRLYVPTTKEGVNSFFLVHLGGFIPLSTKFEFANSYEFGPKNQDGGFYMQLGPGFEAKRILMSIGYRMLVFNGEIGNYCFIKIGVRIGRNVAPYKKL